MEMKEIAAKSEADLKVLDTSLRREMLNLRFQQANGDSSKASDMKKKRRALARVQTRLSALKNAKKVSG